MCIIPARGGSKGLPRKNVKLIDNEPLISRAIRHAMESGVIGTVLVTTDDQEIAQIAKNSGAIVPFIRPSNLAEDLTTTEDTLKHALTTYEEMIDKKFELAIFLTSTDIFRNPKWIKEGVEKMENNSKLESVFSGHETHKNFWERQENGSWKRVKEWMSGYSSRQIRRCIIREDTGLMCVSRAWLWREGRRIGNNVEIIINNDDFTGIDIHHEEDLKLANKAIEIRRM
ncbi:MAG: acylneuraminate cytidylyltransferase family protein [Candidatus Marinimicrobia bacterium]|nr:acylneuraminate cytidylyltransferase family protein [Candidatus Neomarinimicrobiota bacterium]